MTKGQVEDVSRGLDCDAAAAEYAASRARYIRTITADAERRLAQSMGKRREPLVADIANLTVLAHHRYEAYRGALRDYAVKAPNRVNARGLMSPSPTDRVAGADKLYKATLKAADDYREVEELIKKRKSKLEEIDYGMRAQIEQHGRDLIARLETSAGLEAAFKRDPLLGRAHARMMAAQSRQANALGGKA